MTGLHTLSKVGALALAALLTVGLTGAREAQAWTTMYNCNSAWPSSSLPVAYRVSDGVTSVGTAASSLDELRAIYRSAFEAWGGPCCSAFSASDAGTTTATGDDRNDSLNTISVRTNDWPRAYGSSNVTLGVTWTAVDGRCDIVGSDVIFNAVTWSYSDGGAGGSVDLESIAVHEFGHFIGLGHSTGDPDATMFPQYTGPGQRVLGSDDEEGVCALYAQACNCSSNSQCNGSQECIDSVCQIPPCESDLDCEAGLSCNDFGDCVVPPCESDADCTGGNVCSSGSCVPDADCPICGQCDTNADCGNNGVCIPAGFISSTTACTQWCQSAADCPGNTDCFLVPTQDGDVPLCFNPDADSAGACPSGFVCEDDSGPFDPCDGVQCPSGQTCNSLTGQCQGGGATDTCTVCDSCTSDAQCGTGGSCLNFTGGPTVCSVACASDGSCPGDSACFQLDDGSGGAQNWCLNEDAFTAGVCAGGWECTDQSSNPCEGVSCPSGQACNPSTGFCESTGGGGDFDVPDVGDREVGPGGGGGAGDDGGCQVVASGSKTLGDALWLALAGLALLVGGRRRRR